MSHIDSKSLESFRQNFVSEGNTVSVNSVTNNNLNDVALNRENYRQISHVFSHKVKNEGKVTNQKSSGRCWIFAALNMMRQPMMQEFNLESDFEFSQSYVFFYDKLERSNYFLECIYNTLELDTESREIKHLLNDPLCDGGQWDMFVSVVQKYGLVPKSVYNESFNSSNSRRMNWILTYKLREYAWVIREKKKKTAKEVLKQQFLSEIYRILCTFLGPPPSNFNWEYYDKSSEHHRIKNLTPLSFLEMVPVKLNDYYCVIHDPRNEYGQCYTVKYLGNVVEGRQIKYINLPIKQIKDYAIESIKNNESIWFGCDVGKWFERNKCVMDIGVFNYENIFDINFNLNKRDRLNYSESLMTHAMLFTGLDLDEENNTVTNEKNTVVNRWRVENSWSESGPAKGYYIMDDKWFDEYVYEVVIHKKYLDKDSLEKLNNNEDITTFPPWDPFGALA